LWDQKITKLSQKYYCKTNNHWCEQCLSHRLGNTIPTPLTKNMYQNKIIKIQSLPKSTQFPRELWFTYHFNSHVRTFQKAHKFTAVGTLITTVFVVTHDLSVANMLTMFTATLWVRIVTTNCIFTRTTHTS
jgi:hypothetical protein